jgi:amino acid adenylation domain-containing protein/non-ribosomal peptide synthase protein (TIGR01720 family)
VNATLPTLFERQVEKSPNSIAVACNDKLLTYRELNNRANQLSHYLIGLGAGPEDYVAVLLERSTELVVAMLAILKSGAGYLPLDPKYPTDRLEFMLGDAKPRLVISDRETRERLPRIGDQIVVDDVQIVELVKRGFVGNPNDETRTKPLRVENPVYAIYTSGSTGRPKGIVMPGEGLLNVLAWHGGVSGDASNRVAQFLSTSFDFSTHEIFSTLITGKALFIPKNDERDDPARFLEWLDVHQISEVFGPNAILQAICTASVEEARTVPSLRKIFHGGEPLVATKELIDFYDGHTDQRVYNYYGPTESQAVTFYALPRNSREWVSPVAIGRPVRNVRLYVLDTGLQPVPKKTSGELYVSGVQLARGYLNRPSLTADRFVANPFGERGSRMYRTGDLVRWREDGNLEFLARVDDQVKVRGHRIELGEVEATLLSVVEVGQAAVVSRSSELGQTDLVAYVVPREKSVLVSSELRRQLVQKLPGYMIPADFVILESMPLTANGKINRKALPAPERRSEGEYSARGRHVEEVVAGLFCELLLLQRVGAKDSFFELGGHSLLATRLVSQARRIFGVELPLRAVFEEPTVSALADRIEVLQRTANGIVLPPLKAQLRPKEIPLSFAQERLWVIEQFESLGATYNVPVALRLLGRLDVMALESAINQIVARHESLRTRCESREGRPVQIVEPVVRLRLEVEDLSGLGADRENAIEEAVRRFAVRPFDLKRGPLVRAGLLRVDVDEHVAMLTMHHIVSDGWSMGILVEEVSELYTAYAIGRSASLAPLPLQYADYALWQRDWLREDTLERQLEYWTKCLEGAPPWLQLPTDRQRPAAQSFRGAQYPVALSRELSTQLSALARRGRATPFMLLLAAYNVLLSRWASQDDIVVGSPIANRRDVETENLIGFFVNTLALRTKIAPRESFQELVAAVREATISAYAHQDLPFERLVEALQPERDLSRQPIFQVGFALQNIRIRPLSLPGLELRPIEQDTFTSKFDLTLFLSETEDGFHGSIEYSTDLFEAATIGRFVENFQCLLQQIARDPAKPVDEIEILAPKEREQLVVEWNNTSQPLQTARLPELFEQTVERTPNTVSVVSEKGEISYRELNIRSNQLAHFLIKQGIGPEDKVALALPRSEDLVVSILAVLKAGAAYIPLDLSSPLDRTVYVVDHAKAKCVLTSERSGVRFPDSSITVNLDAGSVISDLSASPTTNPSDLDRSAALFAQNLAYIIYTSGSTGKPKGVLISHENVTNYLRWARAYYFQSKSPANFSLFTNVAFDLTVTSIFLPLISGERVYVFSDEFEAFIDKVGELVEVDALKLTPIHLGLLMETSLPDKIGTLIVGGDALSTSLAKRVNGCFNSNRIVYNEYGPTEATVGCIAFSCATEGGTDFGNDIPIGAPIWNTTAYVLGRSFAPMPIGAIGELYVGGAQLARGYLGQPAVTAERFVANPFGQPGSRLYRTGDLARWRPDGIIEYKGRVDRQVKIRGFRVELGEVEAVLGEHPGVIQTAVNSFEDARGEKRVAAYVVLQKSQEASQNLAERERWIANWQDVFNDDVYFDGIDRIKDPRFNTGGWNSSVTGAEIPVEEMQEWLDCTVRRIEGLGGTHILEIGSGSGMLLFRLARSCLKYHGTDFSRRSIEYVRRHIGTYGLRNIVELSTKRADDFSGIEAGYYELIVLNSVIQYFPDSNYLKEVLLRAVNVTSEGGRVFIGDVRSLPLYEHFQVWLELERESSSKKLLEVARTIRERMAKCEELLLAPAFFWELQRECQKIRRVEILPKFGRCLNELTKFRYDVVIHTQSRETAEADWVDWGKADLTEVQIRERLCAEQPIELAIENIPNRRVTDEVRLLESIRTRGGASVQDVLDSLKSSSTSIGVEICDLLEIAQQAGYTLQVSWARQDDQGRFDVVFQKSGATRLVRFKAPEMQARGPHANEPARNGTAGRFFSELRTYLRQRVPEQMVPDTFVNLESLPVTRNGKVSYDELPVPDFRGLREYIAPRTEKEKAVARLFGEVLLVERVGSKDNFFELGGDSIRAIEFVSRARESGLVITARDLFQFPSVEALASVAEDISTEGAGALKSESEDGCSLTPIMHWLLERGGNIDDFCQSSLLQVPRNLTYSVLCEGMSSVVKRHASLRLRLASQAEKGTDWSLEAQDPGSVVVRDCVRWIDVSARSRDDRLSVVIEWDKICRDCLAPLEGRLLSCVWFDAGAREPGRLLVVIHHIAVDNVSWRIFISDLARHCESLLEGVQTPALQPSTSFQHWSSLLEKRAYDTDVVKEVAYWWEQIQPVEPLIGKRSLDPSLDTIATRNNVNRRLSRTIIDGLVTTVPAAFHATIHELLIGAFALAAIEWRSEQGITDESSVLVEIEGHGRQEEFFCGVNLSETIGWFTTLYPVRFDLGALAVKHSGRTGSWLERSFKRVKEQLRGVPNFGFNYGLLRYLNDSTAVILSKGSRAQFSFNYHGRISAPEARDWTPASEWLEYRKADNKEVHVDQRAPLAIAHSIEVNAVIVDSSEGSTLFANWAWPEGIFEAPDIQEFADKWDGFLTNFVRHVRNSRIGGRSPSDFRLVSLSQGEIDQLEARAFPQQELED